MLSEEIKNRMTHFFINQLKEDFSQKQLKLLQKIIKLADENTIVIDRSGTECTDTILRAINSLPSDAPDSSIDKQAQITLQHIDLLIKKQSLNQLHQNSIVGFIADDKYVLHKHPNRNNTWLTDVQVEQLMPKDSKHFVTLAPTSPNLLMITNVDDQPVNMQDQLKNPDIKSIVLPVGPGHWRLVSIEKKIANDKLVGLSVKIFDSFGEHSAKAIHTEVARWVQSQTKVPYTIDYEAPKKTQKDGFSCADYIIAKTNEISKKYLGYFDQALVDALEDGQPLRPFMIEASKKIDNKWLNFRIQQPEKEDLVTYHNKDGSTTMVDKKTQIERDKQLAQALQAELDEQTYRTGPK